MHCPPQGNPRRGTAGDHKQDVRGKTGEPRGIDGAETALRLELVCGGAKTMS